MSIENWNLLTKDLDSGEIYPLVVHSETGMKTAEFPNPAEIINICLTDGDEPFILFVAEGKRILYLRGEIETPGVLNVSEIVNPLNDTNEFYDFAVREWLGAKVELSPDRGGDKRLTITKDDGSFFNVYGY